MFFVFFKLIVKVEEKSEDFDFFLVVLEMDFKIGILV